MPGPRIVLNPAVFRDKRDAACVAMNEAIRLVCEENGFEPVSEPTEKQRKFFADTAYADDELQLRRTILARIATLDTSVSDPTDEQLEETAEMLEMVMEVGAPQNEWEQQAVQRLHDVIVKMRESPRGEPAATPPAPRGEGSATAAMGGGETKNDEVQRRHRGYREDLKALMQQQPVVVMSRRDPTPEELHGTLRASPNVMPRTLATALGAEVDPMEAAKEGYRAVARGEIEDPLLSRGAARAIGAALSAYQGLEAVAGATGIGNPRTISPPRSPRGGNLGPRGATAGYIAEKSGRSVEDVLKQNRARRAERRFDAIFPEGRAEMEAWAEALAAREAQERSFDEMDALEAQAIAANTADAISRRRISGSLKSFDLDVEKVLDAVRGVMPADRKNSLVAVRVGNYKGLGHPSFMVLPADNVESAANYIQKWARFGVAAGGGSATFVPLSSVDPAVDPRNTLFSGDAYTKSLPRLFDELYGKGSFNQMADRMRHSAKHHRKTDGSPLTKHDVELQVQRRASDMVTSILQASDPQTYNPNLPGLRQFSGINETTRKLIYDKFQRDNTFAEAKPRRVLSGDETFTIEGDSSDYDPESGGYARHMYSGDLPDRTRLLQEAIIRYRQDAKGGNTRQDWGRR